jgi:predicted DNA-binding transcriptional regulator AlpA
LYEYGHSRKFLTCDRELSEIIIGHDGLEVAKLMVQLRHEDELVDAPEVRRLLGEVSEMWLRRRLNPDSRYYDPEFPQPIQYLPGGRRHWSRGEVVAYRERRRSGGGL